MSQSSGSYLKTDLHPLLGRKRVKVISQVTPLLFGTKFSVAGAVLCIDVLIYFLILTEHSSLRLMRKRDFSSPCHED